LVFLEDDDVECPCRAVQSGIVFRGSDREWLNVADGGQKELWNVEEDITESEGQWKDDNAPVAPERNGALSVCVNSFGYSVEVDD
jgi:hypothetical protein